VKQKRNSAGRAGELKMYWAKPVKDARAMGFERWLDATTWRKIGVRGKKQCW
jgi:hypothetical protein